MTRSPALALRTIAIAIAIAALLDPAITSNRTTRPVISVIADSRSRALADRVDRTLSKSFDVIRAPASNADGTVLVGYELPASLEVTSAPTFAVVADRDGPTVTVEAMRAPAWTPADARAPIAVGIHVTGARGRTVEATLHNGDLVVDRVTRVIASDDEHAALSLGFVPTAVGAAALRVDARVEGTTATAGADGVVDVRDRRWAVLFFDPRPSWMSTFARRALEQDSRFVVSSRVITSRNVSTDAGNPPGRLDDLASLQLYDAVVVGAPEALTANDVAGLEAFLRRRGGGVVLLFDRRASGPYERLTQVAHWNADSTGKAASIVPMDADSGGLRASETTWPARLPAGAEPVARAGANRPVVWRSPVGAGQLIVSGALDAWRFRDRPGSTFDRFWQALVAEAATSAPPAVDIVADQAVIAPNGETNVAVTLREPALSPVRPIRASVVATLESTQPGQLSRNIRLWPDANAGQFRGSVGGAAPGLYRLVVETGGSRASIPIVVAPHAGQPTSDSRDLLAAFARAHGGRALPASRIKSLPVALTEAIHPLPHLETWHPMQSAWWIVPFVLALSGEWWLRRRRGLA